MDTRYREKRGNQGIGKYVKSVIALLVMIIVFATVLVPVINAETDHTEVINQSSLKIGMMDSDDSTQSHTLVYDHYPYWIIDGVKYKLSPTYTYIFDDAGILLRATGSSAEMWKIAGEYVTVTAAELTIHNGIIDGTINGNPYSYTWIGTLYFPSDSGNYVMTSGGPIYLLEDTECFVKGMTVIDKKSNREVVFEGNIIRGFTLSYLADDGTIITYESITSPVPVSGYEDLYSVSSIQFEDSFGRLITFDRFVTDKSIVATKEHDHTVDTLLLMIPTLVGVSLLLGAIRWMGKEETST